MSTTNTSWFSVALKATGVLVLAVGVAGMWGLSAVINVLHQWQQNDDYILAAISGASDILKAGAALAVIYAVRKRLVSVGCAALVIWLSCTSWSVYSGFGYVSTKLIAAEDSRVLRKEADQSLIEEVRATQRRIEFMRSTTIKDAKERLSMQSDIRAAEQRLDRLRARLDTREGTTSANPVGKALETLFGVNSDVAAIAKILIFLAVLEFGSNLGLVAFSHLLRWPPQVWDDEPARPAPAATTAAPEIITLPTAPELAVVARNAPSDLQIRRFFKDMAGKYGAGKQVPLRDIQAAYAAWCQTNREQPLIRPNLLGQELVKHGAKKGQMNAKAPTYVLPAA